MALSKLQAESLNLADTYAFTGTVTGAGEITASTTAPSEGGAATTNVVQGLVKVWSNFNGSGTPATRDSFNVSGLTDNGAGSFDVNHTNNMSAAEFSYYVASDTWHKFNPAYSTSLHRIYTASSSFAGQDATNAFTAVNGDLA